MNFKFLAIKPLGNCDVKYLKNLQQEKLYKFYNDYAFLDENGIEIKEKKQVVQIKNRHILPKDLYKLNSGLNVNISAIVGKNGSGKSTLLELLYASCFAIASQHEILTSVNSINEKLQEIDFSHYLNKAEIINIEKDIKKFKDNYVAKDYKIDFTYTTVEEKTATLEKRKEEIEQIFKCLNVEIFYELDSIFYKVVLSNSEIRCYDVNKNLEIQNFSFMQYFFYNIAINYSLYGLNEEVLGEWVSALFHKNDGYRTPLVINPYRKSGNIDVNSEIHLAQTRLLTYISLTNNKEILKDKEVESIKFTLSAKNFQEKKVSQFENYDIFNEIYNGIYGENSVLIEKAEINKVPNFDFLMNYIKGKINKITKVYEDYHGFELFENETISQRTIEKLKKDKSHVTLKLRQTLNIINFNLLENDTENQWKQMLDGSYSFHIQIDKLIARIVNIKNINYSREELIPMGCNHLVVHVKNHKQNKDSISEMNTLSSGEQHFIHTIHSVLYHLLNVNSVHKKQLEENKNEEEDESIVEKINIKYEYVNIIFDEIELYFHPEYQRRFVFELLEHLNKLGDEKKISNIKGINMLFCTHSPFILSDIPKQNVLFLDERKDDKSTFASNISTMLSESFFMNDLIGEFAKQKINETLKWEGNDKVETFKFIELIDEPILRYKLTEMFCSKYPDESKEIDKKSKISKLKAYAKILGINSDEIFK